MNILIDASALMAVLIEEPEKEYIVSATKDYELIAPSILPHEIGNALTRLKRRQVLNDKQIILVYNEFLKIPLRFLEIDIINALELACRYSIYAYDAYYLEMANRYNLPLLTLDKPMKKIALDLNLRILEERSESL